MRKYFKNILQVVLLTFISAAHGGAYEDFFRAVNVDDSRTLGALLERGFDPNSVDEHGQVGLFLAYRVGSTKVASALLAHPAIKVDAENAAGETPLMMASMRGDIDAMRRLLDKGSQLNRKGWTPLHYAASGPSLEALELLLSRGADIEAASPNGTTPVMMAARYGSDDAAFALVKKGADTRKKNDKGLNAADFARLGGRERLAAALESPLR
jgi:ankyrin repeat protein